jgi:hypothetical protein
VHVILNAFITRYLLVTCFDRRHDHLQGNLQRVQKTVKMQKRNTDCYKPFLKPLTQPLVLLQLTVICVYLGIGFETLFVTSSVALTHLNGLF